MQDDAELLAIVLGTYTRHDPVPADVIAAAEAVWALVPAAIDWDWLERLDEPCGVRGPSAQLVSFGFADGSDPMVLDVELYRERDAMGVRGLVTPADERTRVDICWPDGQLTAGVDHLGRFEAVGLPNGPMRLVVRRFGERAAATEWFVS